MGFYRGCRGVKRFWLPVYFTITVSGNLVHDYVVEYRRSWDMPEFFFQQKIFNETDSSMVLLPWAMKIDAMARPVFYEADGCFSG